MFSVKHGHHGLLVDSHHRAIGHCGCGAQAEWLSCKATFSEEIALVQHADRGFLPALRHNGEFYLPFLCVKHGVGRIALSKDRLLFGEASIFLPPSMVERNVLGSNLLSFLAVATGVTISLLLGRDRIGRTLILGMKKDELMRKKDEKNIQPARKD